MVGCGFGGGVYDGEISIKLVKMPVRNVEISVSVAVLGSRKFAFENDTPGSALFDLVEFFACDKSEKRECGSRICFEVDSTDCGLRFGMRRWLIKDAGSEDVEFIIPAIFRTS